MEGWKGVCALLHRDDYMVKVDLKNAYNAIVTHPALQKYLCFHFENKVYQYKVLVFGLNIAPRDFTKIMKAVLKPLRRKGICLVVYLDNILILGSLPEEVSRHTDLLIHHLMSLGFYINLKKSILKLARHQEFLGVDIDS